MSVDSAAPQSSFPYQRILLIGCGGSGKSTLSRQLAKKTGLPLIHLDREFWRPGWVETPKEEWRRKVAELTDGSRWIIDGNFSGSLDIRLPRCDCILLLDYSRITCVLGVLKRWAVFSFGASRPDMGEGCAEKIDPKFLKWVWQFRKKNLPKIQEKINKFPDKAVIVFQNRKQAQRWLDTL